MPSTFIEKLEQLWRQGNFLCIGLDPNYEKLPDILKTYPVEEAILRFNQQIIDETHDLVCAYKPNSAFYEAYGEEGVRALFRTTHYLKQRYAHIPIILDAKRADIGHTNLGYVAFAFDIMEADAVTVHPYLGKEALAPFLARREKGIMVLVKNSNPGSGEFQNLLVGEAQEPLYQVVARNVAQSWNEHGNCVLVVGATYPSELKLVRSTVGDMPILIPGVGAQGGDVQATVQMGKDSRNMGMIINSSRGIIFASHGSDFAHVARQVAQALRDEILMTLRSPSSIG